MIGSGVSFDGIFDEGAQLTFLVSDSGLTKATAEGYAVELDTATANTVKLATSGGPILGRLDIYENRVTEGVKLGTVSLRGGYRFIVEPTAIGGADEPAKGDFIVGAGSGKVKKLALTGFATDAPGIAAAAAAAIAARWRVVEVATDKSYVVAIRI